MRSKVKWYESRWWYTFTVASLLVIAISNVGRLGYAFFFLSMIPVAFNWFHHSKVKKMGG